jgi:hypothetical protein
MIFVNHRLACRAEMIPPSLRLGDETRGRFNLNVKDQSRLIETITIAPTLNWALTSKYPLIALNKCETREQTETIDD